jgi:hypothetical protein
MGELGTPNGQEPVPLPVCAARNPHREPAEVNAPLAFPPLSDVELKRVSRPLATDDLEDMRPPAASSPRMTPRLSPLATSASSRRRSYGTRPRPALARSSDAARTDALAAAHARGAAVKEELLADPRMLNMAAIANLLGLFEEGVRPKCKRQEILGLESARRGIQCPGRKVLEGRELLPALPRLFAMLGASIRGGCSGSCNSAPASSAAIAPSIPTPLKSRPRSGRHRELRHRHLS